MIRLGLILFTFCNSKDMNAKIALNQKHGHLIKEYRRQIALAMDFLTKGNYRAYLIEIRKVDELAQRIHRTAPRKLI